jgi:hypothetical protein
MVEMIALVVPNLKPPFDVNSQRIDVGRYA